MSDNTHIFLLRTVVLLAALGIPMSWAAGQDADATQSAESARPDSSKAAAESQPKQAEPEASEQGGEPKAADVPTEPADDAAQRESGKDEAQEPKGTAGDGQPARRKGRSLEDLRRPPGNLDLPWLQMLASVLLIAAVGVVGYVVAKRVLPRLRRQGAGRLAVEETVHLGPGKTVHLMRVGARTFLVASTKDSVSLLSEVPAPPKAPPPAEEGTA